VQKLYGQFCFVPSFYLAWNITLSDLEKLLPSMPKNTDQNFWNFISSIVFLAILGAFVYVTKNTNGLPTKISLFDFAIMILATFRIILLFVYDKVTEFIRDFFKTEIIEVDEKTGEERKVKVPYCKGPLRTISELFDCPWCMSVWVALFVALAYLYFSWAWIVLVIFAIAGTASLLQLFANMIGWHAVYMRKKSEKE